MPIYCLGMSTVKIMAIIGSLRGASVNRATARAAFASTGDDIEMEVVDLIYILHFSSGRLVRGVDRVLQGQVPDGKRLELCVPSIDARSVVVK